LVRQAGLTSVAAFGTIPFGFAKSLYVSWNAHMLEQCHFVQRDPEPKQW
jgi:hypothetical protein